MKASRKCLLTSCYFCVTVTFRGWVCVKRSFPWFLPGSTGPWVSFISEGFKVLWRHLPIFVTSRWIFSINQSPRICFTQSFDLNSSAGQPSPVSHRSAAPPTIHMSFGVPMLAARLSKVLQGYFYSSRSPNVSVQVASTTVLGGNCPSSIIAAFKSICSSWWLWRHRIKQSPVVIYPRPVSSEIKQLSFLFPCCQEDEKYAQLQ